MNSNYRPKKQQEKLERLLLKTSIALGREEKILPDPNQRRPKEEAIAKMREWGIPTDDCRNPAFLRRERE